MVIHWSDEHVEFFDITHDGKHYDIRLVRHCAYCDGMVWVIDDDPQSLMFRPFGSQEGYEAAIHYIKTELSPRAESARV